MWEISETLGCDVKGAKGAVDWHDLADAYCEMTKQKAFDLESSGQMLNSANKVGALATEAA